MFLTPKAALVAFAVALPITAFVLAERRVAAVRKVLDLPAPRGGADLAVLAALTATVLLLALAAAQPALSKTRPQRVRADAQVLFVIDISRSMAASSGRRRPTRLERAKAAAMRLRASIAEVPAGVATLTDRVLPNLLPVAGSAGFDATLEHAVRIDDPPPRELNVRATSFAALSAVPSSGYFAPSATRRVVVLLTDGESSFFDSAAVARALAAPPRARFVAIQFWRPNEAIYGSSGRPEPNYRPDPASKRQLAALATAAKGRAFAERETARATPAVRSLLGSGPTRSIGRTRTTHPLAPYLAALVLLPLAFVFVRSLRAAPK